jgi:hypothetical protein
VGLRRTIKAYGRFENARRDALLTSLRHPDTASVFLAVLVGAVIGQFAGSAINGSTVSRLAGGVAAGLFVALCIYGSFASHDATARLSRERAEEREDLGP